MPVLSRDKFGTLLSLSPSLNGPLQTQIQHWDWFADGAQLNIACLGIIRDLFPNIRWITGCHLYKGPFTPIEDDSESENLYRPQGKNLFLEASVSHSVQKGEGVCLHWRVLHPGGSASGGQRKKFQPQGKFSVSFSLSLGVNRPLMLNFAISPTTHRVTHLA